MQVNSSWLGNPFPFMWQTAKTVCGHIWKTIEQFSSKIYNSVIRITQVATSIFDDYPDVSASKPHTATPVVSPTLHPLTPKPKKNSPKLSAIPDDEVIDPDELPFSLDQFFDKAVALPKSPPVLPKSPSALPKNPPPLPKSPSASKQEADPMENLAGSISNVNLNQTDPISVPNDELILKSSIAKVTLQGAEAQLGEVESATPTSFQSYLELAKKLEDEMGSLQPYNSIFEKHEPSLHQLIRRMIKTLENKVNHLHKEMCTQAKLHYQPDSSIPGDGSCLFWSFDYQLSKTHGQAHYRKLAADYIREHADEFEMGVADVMKEKQGQASISRYAKSQISLTAQLKTTLTQQSPLEIWKAQLREKLKRDPTNIDLYCDCLENNSTFWGGLNELNALSEQLQRPVLVFTRQTFKTWRFDGKWGNKKFSDQPPLLFYYSGGNHYQSLNPKKIKSK